MEPHRGDGAMEQKLASAHHEAMEHDDDMMPVMLDEGEVLEVLGAWRGVVWPRWNAMTCLLASDLEMPLPAHPFARHILLAAHTRRGRLQ